MSARATSVEVQRAPSRGPLDDRRLPQHEAERAGPNGAGRGDAAGARSLLRDPNVRRLAIAYTISSMGTAMAAVAIAYVAYRETGSVVLTALVYSGNTLPFLFLAPLSSRIVSQFDLRLAMIALDAGKIAILVPAAAIALAGQLSYALILAFTFGAGGLAALGIAAWPRIAECAAPPGRLADLNALLKTIPAVAGITGAVLGGTVILTLGEGWVFAMDAASYVPLIAALALMPTIPALPRRPGAIRSGLRFVRRDERLHDAFILVALLNFAAFPLLSMLPAMAADIDSRGHVLGILTCAFSREEPPSWWRWRRCAGATPTRRSSPAASWAPGCCSCCTGP